jgi:hypothetical protein
MFRPGRGEMGRRVDRDSGSGSVPHPLRCGPFDPPFRSGGNGVQICLFSVAWPALRSRSAKALDIRHFIATSPEE